APKVRAEQLIGTIEQVETHPNDPTSQSEPDPWEAVSDQFSTLKGRLTDLYQQAAADGGPSESDVKEALSTLAAAWDRVADSVTTALGDPDTREGLKRAASSLATALGATVAGLGKELMPEPTGGGSGVSDASRDQAVEESGTGGGVVDGDGEPSATSERDL
ncbi:MAG: hypothetical protein WB245_04855, partial [Acidimicrobiia bacterium]